MDTTWIGYVVAALIGLSVLYELGTGTARLRGIGRYQRREQPGAYWLVLGAKSALAVAAALLARLPCR